jgi:four helix bundle protein
MSSDEKRPVNSYRDLLVWRQGMELAVAAYKLSSEFPRDELYGMTSQVRRSAASIPANIAEGYGRESSGAYVQQLRVAQGSLKELETHLLLASRVGITTIGAITPLLDRADEVGKMLRGLIRSIQNTS